MCKTAAPNQYEVIMLNFMHATCMHVTCMVQMWLNTSCMIYDVYVRIMHGSCIFHACMCRTELLDYTLIY